MRLDGAVNVVHDLVQLRYDWDPPLPSALGNIGLPDEARSVEVPALQPSKLSVSEPSAYPRAQIARRSRRPRVAPSSATVSSDVSRYTAEARRFVRRVWRAGL